MFAVVATTLQSWGTNVTDAEATLMVAIIAWTIASIIWGLRLEGRVNYVQKMQEQEAASRIADLKKVEALEKEMNETLGAIRESLVRIETTIKYLGKG